MTFKAGDPIWYRQTCRGGYGYQRDVPGVFIHAAPRRAVVLLVLDDAEKRVAVSPSNIRPRAVEPEARAV